MADLESYDELVSKLKEKAIHKQRVLETSKLQFKLFKKQARLLAEKMTADMGAEDGIEVTYISKGKYEFEIRFGEDILLFLMHTDVFDFDKSHRIWKRSYVDDDRNRAFCGMITVFNFLKTSFEMNRSEDIGYLIGRIFINEENHFFVEGKKQLGFLYNDFGDAILTEDDMRSIILSAIDYCHEFDLLTPPFTSMGQLQVGQVQDYTTQMKFKTGKRLGFQFSWDKEDPE